MVSISSPRPLDRAAAATQIQTFCRGYLERRFYVKLQAIVSIQTVWRSYVAQQTVENQLLPRSLYQQAIQDIEKQGLSSFPRASSGNKCVYVLKKVVIKECGLGKCLDILTEISLARQVCKENGYKHICIPRGRIYKNTLVVEKLSFSYRTKAQIGLYLDYHHLFTEAVKEFAEFYFKTRIIDVIDGSKKPNSYKSLMLPSKVHLCRYDNLAMYIKPDPPHSKSIGELGLIDLDGFSPKSELSTLNRAYEKCKLLMYMFPYHSINIFEIAVSYEPRLNPLKMRLETHRETALTFFQLTYEDHLQFAKQKKIDITRPSWFNTFTHKEWDLREDLSNALQQENRKGSFKNCLREGSLEEFNKKVFPKLILAIYTMIHKGLENRVERYGTIHSLNELLDARTLRFDLFHNVTQLQETFPSLPMFNIQPEENLPFLKKIVEFLLMGLEQHKLVAKYIPEFGFPPNQIQCLFC